jgi:hypothetical protein
MDRYIGTKDGAVLGPYADHEITAWEDGKRTLGYPDKKVYAVRANSVEQAKRKIQSEAGK